MKEEGYQGRTVTVKVRFTDFKTYTRAKTFLNLQIQKRKLEGQPLIVSADLNSKGKFGSLG